MLKHVNISKMQENKQLCLCVHLVCMCVHEVMHGVCLDDAWQGIVRHKLGKVCKTHTQLSKHGNQVQSRVFPKIGTHLSPKQYKNVT